MRMKKITRKRRGRGGRRGRSGSRGRKRRRKSHRFLGPPSHLPPLPHTLHRCKIGLTLWGSGTNFFFGGVI